MMRDPGQEGGIWELGKDDKAWPLSSPVWTLSPYTHRLRGPGGGPMPHSAATAAIGRRRVQRPRGLRLLPQRGL
eukprot:bmy_15158T0